MNWDEVEAILHGIHCSACDGYGCDHAERVAEALVKLQELFYAQADRLEEL